MNGYLSKILLVILLLFIINPVIAQQGQISISSGVDRDVITIGDLINYNISVVHDKGIKVEYPGLGVNLGAFEIRNYKIFEPEEVDKKIINKVEYIITTFDTGNYVIPPITVSYFSSDSIEKELKTDIIKIRVNSVKPSEAKDIRDIKPQMEIKADYRRYIYYGLAGLGAVLLACILIFYLKKRKRGENIIPKRRKPIKPAHIEAIEELEKLMNSNLLSDGRAKEFYIIISEIVRRYIENRYFIYALEMTTNQVYDSLYNIDVDKENIELIYEFLSSCDLVKFAKYIPEESENKKVIEQAFDVINKTKIEFSFQPLEVKVE